MTFRDPLPAVSAIIANAIIISYDGTPLKTVVFALV